MSQLYVKVQCGFYVHRKTLRLKAALGDDAFWIPPRLWAFAAENRPDGIFNDYSAEEIATSIGYTRDASKMLEALLKAGFMDADPLRIHDWDKHNAYHKTFSERAKKAATAKWARAKQSPSVPSPNKDKDIERGVSIASSNACSIPPALSAADKISHEKELERSITELAGLGKQSDYAQNSTKWKRVGELTNRQVELRKILGVVA